MKEEFEADMKKLENKNKHDHINHKLLSKQNKMKIISDDL